VDAVTQLRTPEVRACATPLRFVIRKPLWSRGNQGLLRLDNVPNFAKLTFHMFTVACEPSSHSPA